MGMPMFIIAVIRSQQSFIISIDMPSIGIISQTMPVGVILQVMVHIIMGMAIIPPIIGICIGIMPFIIGICIGIIPPIIGICMGIMLFIIGIILFIIGICMAGFITLSGNFVDGA
ncbi:hypothetical protein SAMN05443582_103400 [Phyllobacterium sp. OV277]|nr:hypothetical protein SAMN05443582_103400 [Phyllobacterium sp. OV277]